MLTFLDHFKYHLTCSLRTDDETISIPPDAAKRLNDIAEGDHVYITVNYDCRFEVVKFTKTSKVVKYDEVSIQRDVNNLGRKNFPRGSCIEIEWTKRTMDEYIKQVEK